MKLDVAEKEGDLDIYLDPPRGIGIIAIGMPFSNAQNVLQEIPGYVPPRPGRTPRPGYAHYESEMTISVSPNLNDTVKAIEIYRPSRDVRVLFQEIDVFSMAAADVISRLHAIVHLEIQDGGRLVVAPDLLLSLWREVLPESPEDEDGRYFESVLVAAPGYYS